MPRRRRTHRITLAAARRHVRSWRRGLRAMAAALWTLPPAIRFLVGATIIVLTCSAVNWTYHAMHKPTEIFFPLDKTFDKRPLDTWREYGTLFRKHSTAVVTPELLAALAQIEGGGNPVGRTYWRWRRTWNPLELYQPASSAVGMYQITDAAFNQARRYCIHDHQVVEDGPWHDMRSCWFNSLYTRVLPSHAIELTAVLLDRGVAYAVTARPISPATSMQKQDLAAVIHLCGVGAGYRYAARGFRLIPNQRCGDHDVSSYLARVNGMMRRFALLATSG